MQAESSCRSHHWSVFLLTLCVPLPVFAQTQTGCADPDGSRAEKAHRFSLPGRDRNEYQISKTTAIGIDHSSRRVRCDPGCRVPVRTCLT